MATSFDDALGALLADAPRQMGVQLLDQLLLNPWFYAVLLGVLLLEGLVPARPRQRSFSVGFRQDLLWTAVKVPFNVLAIGFYLILFRQLYLDHLDFLTIHAVDDWPW